MPPRLYSRYSFTQAIPQPDATLQLSDYEPYRYVALDDNIQYTAVAGDTYFHIAGQFYGAIGSRPAGFFWVICDFQPVPVVDPTVPPAVGSILWIPSARTVTEVILNEARRAVTLG